MIDLLPLPSFSATVVVVVVAAILTGSASAFITQFVSWILYERNRILEARRARKADHEIHYARIYKLAKNLELALVSYSAVVSHKDSRYRGFAHQSYCILRQDCIDLIEALDWRRNDSMQYLPRKLESRCIQVRENLIEALNATIVKDFPHITECEVVKHDHGIYRIYTYRSPKTFEKFIMKPNIYYMVRNTKGIAYSPFDDPKIFKVLSKGISQLLRDTKLILAH